MVGRECDKSRCLILLILLFVFFFDLSDNLFANIMLFGNNSLILFILAVSIFFVTGKGVPCLSLLNPGYKHSFVFSTSRHHL